MSRWDKKAAKLREKVCDGELEQERAFASDPSEERARWAIVHTREDIVLIVSHLSSANQQLAAIRRILLSILLVFVAAFALKLLHYW